MDAADKDLLWLLPGGPDETFGARISRVKEAWHRRAEQALAPCGLSLTQFILLARTAWLIRGGEQPTQNRIACYAMMDRMMVSKALRALEDKGHISRRDHPDDPRAYQIALTEAGMAALAVSAPVMRQVQDAFFGRLGPEGMALFAGMLDRLIDQNEGAAETPATQKELR
jgi:DNA-binding MarR family transcriptional regulator